MTYRLGYRPIRPHASCLYRTAKQTFHASRSAPQFHASKSAPQFCRIIPIRYASGLFPNPLPTGIHLQGAARRSCLYCWLTAETKFRRLVAKRFSDVQLSRALYADSKSCGCELPNLCQEVPRLLELLSPGALGLLMATSSQLRSIVRPAVTKMALKKLGTPDFAFMTEAVWCRHHKLSLMTAV